MRQRGTPALVGADGAVLLQPVTLGGSSGYDEAWLQQLIFAHPEILPVRQIEPGFGTLVPAAMEVPCGHGFIDNLYLTPAGDIVLVETKLWKNPQGRREVVAQALDYVAAISRMSAVRFEVAVSNGQRPGGAPSCLYTLVKDQPDALPEEAFWDALARNLERGRMLVIVAGEGIRHESEALADLLQSHAGAHFSFALVELATFQAGDQLLVVPSTLARTKLVERGIVHIHDHRQHVVEAVPAQSVSPKPASLSEQDFWAAIRARSEPAAAALQRMLVNLESYGVYTELKASLGLRVALDNLSKPLSLGYIQKNGQLWTNGVAAAAPLSTGSDYLAQLAEIIDGVVARPPSGSPYVSTDGKTAPRVEDLLPAHAEAWETAIIAFIRSVAGELKAA